MTFEQTLLISILGSLITGSLSVLGVVLTIRQNNKQLQTQIEDRRKKDFQEIIDNRPELQIIERKVYDTPCGYQEDGTVNIDCLMVLVGTEFNKEDFSKNLVYVEYTLQNIGKSLIEYIEFATHKPDIALLDFQGGINDSKIQQINNYCLNGYIRFSKIKIHSNDKIKIRIWYKKDAVAINCFCYTCWLGLKSFDKRYWRQNFGVPYEELEESIQMSECEYNGKITKRDYYRGE